MNKLTLHHGDPKVLMVHDPKHECITCGYNYWLEQAGEASACLSCCFQKSGKPFLVLFGWKIIQSANQMIASRVSNA